MTINVKDNNTPNIMLARALRKDNGEEIIGQVIRVQKNIYIIDNRSIIWLDEDFGEIESKFTEIKPETLSYATGIKDIYDGDILEDKYKRKVVCVWWQDNAEYIMVDLCEYIKGNKDEPAYHASFSSWLDLVKIGDIYQNPELLEEK